MQDQLPHSFSPVDGVERLGQRIKGNRPCGATKTAVRREGKQ